MSIQFFCDCGQEVTVAEDLAGQRLRCPVCGSELIVPRFARADRNRHQPTEDSSSHYQGSANKTEVSGKAILSFTLGLLSFVANIFAAIPAFIIGLMGLNDINQARGRLTGRGLAIAGLITSVVGLAFSALLYVGIAALVTSVKDTLAVASSRFDSEANLERIASALEAYGRDNSALPPANFRLNQGRPNHPANSLGLSWRVAILPYLGQQDLYDSFHLDEPWDSPHNKDLIAMIPEEFVHPNANERDKSKGLTHYRVFVGMGTAFDPAKVAQKPNGDRVAGVSFPGDFTDGLANTLLVVEASEPVEWTRPDELPFVPDRPLPRLGGLFTEGFYFVTADGAPHFAKKNIKDSVMQALITRNGTEAINWGDVEVDN